MNKIFKTKYDVTTGQTKVVSELANNRQVASRVEGSSVGVGQPKCGVFFGGMLGAFKLLPLALVVSGALSGVAYGYDVWVHSADVMEESSASPQKSTLNRKTQIMYSSERPNNIPDEAVILSDYANKTGKNASYSNKDFNQTVVIGSRAVVGGDKGTAIGFGAATGENTATSAHNPTVTYEEAKSILLRGEDGSYKDLREQYFEFATNPKWKPTTEEKKRNIINQVITMEKEKRKKDPKIALNKEGTAVGYRSFARGEEATALGNDVVAWGDSSISIGSDNAAGHNAKPLSKEMFRLFYNVRDDFNYTKEYAAVNFEIMRDDNGKPMLNEQGQLVAENNPSYPIFYNGKYYFRKNNQNNDEGYYVMVGEDFYFSRPHAQYLEKIGSDTPGYAAKIKEIKSLNDYKRYELYLKKEGEAYQKYLADHRNTKTHTWARGNNAIAIGARSIAYGDNSTALGTFAVAAKDYSTAIGSNTVAFGKGSLVMGNNSYVYADGSVGIGNKVQAIGAGSMVYGKDSFAGGLGSLAIGDHTFANVKMGKVFNGEGLTIDQYNLLVNGKQNYPTYTNGGPQGLTDNKITIEDLYRFGDTAAIQDIMKEHINAHTTVQEGTGEEKAEQSKDSQGRHNQGAIAIGSYSVALGDNAISLGRYAYAKEDSTVALGRFAFAQKESSFSIGNFTRALGKQSVAFGTHSLVEADDSMALGIKAKVLAEMPTALRSEKNKQNGKSDFTIKNAMAIGNGAEASFSDSIALGVNAKTDYTQTEMAQGGWAPKNAISIPSSERIGYLSVGGKNAERRIVNVAPGASDTDAVNVSQLRALEEAILYGNTLEEDNINSGVKYVSVKGLDELKLLVTKEQDYKNYAKVKKEYLKLKARKERNNEEINLDDIKSKVEAYERKYSDFKTVAEKLKTEDEKNYKLLLTQNAKQDPELEKKKRKEWLEKAYKDIEDAYNKDIAKDKLEGLFAPEQKEKFAKSNFLSDGAKKSGSMAIGVGAKSNAENSIVIGQNATIDEMEARNSILLGNDTSTKYANAVALGYQSVADRAHEVINKANDTAYISKELAGKLNGNMYAPVSVGKNGGDIADISNQKSGDKKTILRQIVNVAPGTKDTDVVILAQLKEAMKGVKNVGTLHYLSVNNPTSEGLNYDNEGATGTNAVAIGVGAQSKAENAVVIGTNVSIDVPNSFVLGSDNKVETTPDKRRKNDAVVVMGSGTTIKNSWATTAIGAVKASNGKHIKNGTPITGAYIENAPWATVIGNKSKIYNGTDIISLANNIEVNVNKEAFDSNKDANSNLVIIGNKAKAAHAKNSVVIGSGAKAQSKDLKTNRKGEYTEEHVGYESVENAVSIGQGATSRVTGAVAIGSGATVEKAAGDSIAIGNGSKATAKEEAKKDATVAVDGKNIKFKWTAGVSSDNTEGKKKSVLSIGKANNERIIKNVAAGAVTATSTDAINGSQLYAVADEFSKLAVNVLGAEVEDANKTGFKKSEFTALLSSPSTTPPQPQGQGQTQTTQKTAMTFKQAIEANIAKLNSGFVFGSGDESGEQGTHYLGDKLIIKAGNITVKDDALSKEDKFLSDNIRTQYEKNNKNILIGIKESPTFKNVLITEEIPEDTSDSAKKNTYDNYAVNKKYLDKRLEKVAANFTVKGDNSGTDKEKVYTLDKDHNELNINGDSNITTAVDKDNKKLTVSLNKALTGITSIGKDDKAKIEFSSADSTHHITFTVGEGKNKATVKLDKDSLDLGSKQIKNVASGIGSTTPSDGGATTSNVNNVLTGTSIENIENNAVNVKDLSDVAKAISDKGIQLKGNGTSADTKTLKLGSVLTVDSSQSKKTNANEKDITTKLSSDSNGALTLTLELNKATSIDGNDERIVTSKAVADKLKDFATTETLEEDFLRITGENIGDKQKEFGSNVGISEIKLDDEEKTELVQAQALIDYLKGTGDKSVKVSDSSKTIAEGEGSISIGYDAKSQNEGSIALGYGANALNSGSISIGQGSNVLGVNSIGLGKDNKVNGNFSFVVGDENEIGSKSTSTYVMGSNNNISGERNISIGSSNKIEKDENILLGSNNEVSGTGNILLGSRINVGEDTENAIVLGNQSVAVSNALSVGTPRNRRRIVFVGDPEQDYDAVNKKYVDNLLANKASAFMVTSDEGDTDNISGTLSIKGAEAEGTANNKKHQNITTKASKSELTIALNKDLKGIESIGKDDSNALVFKNNTSSTDGSSSTNTAELKVGGHALTFTPENGTTDTNKKVKISNVAGGQIAENSTDAINGKQLHDLVGKLGLSVDKTGNFTAPSFTKVKGDDTTSTVSKDKYTTYKDAISGLITAVNKGVTFKGNDGTNSSTKLQLGGTLTIDSAPVSSSDTTGANDATVEKDITVTLAPSNGSDPQSAGTLTLKLNKADKVEENNGKVVTSKAVADALKNYTKTTDLVDKLDTAYLKVDGSNIDDKQADFGKNVGIGKVNLENGKKSTTELVQAQALIDYLKGTGDKSVKVSDSPTTEALGDGSVSVGHGAISRNEGSIAMGYGANALNTGAVSIGQDSNVLGMSSIGIGRENTVRGNFSFAVGDNNVIEKEQNYVMGSDNKITGKQNISIGSRNEVEGNENIILGSNITADDEIHNAIVLGTGSLAKSNALSVGSMRHKRKIVFVADPTDNYDAANKKYVDERGLKFKGNDADQTEQLVNLDKLLTIDSSESKTKDGNAQEKDIKTSVKKDGNGAKLTLTLNKADNVSEHDERAVTSKAVAEKLTNYATKFEVEGNKGSKFTVNDSLKIKGKVGSGSAKTHQNITTTANNKNSTLEIALNSDLKGIKSIGGREIGAGKGKKIASSIEFNKQGANDTKPKTNVVIESNGGTFVFDRTGLTLNEKQIKGLASGLGLQAVADGQGTNNDEAKKKAEKANKAILDKVLAGNPGMNKTNAVNVQDLSAVAKAIVGKVTAQHSEAEKVAVKYDDDTKTSITLGGKGTNGTKSSPVAIDNLKSGLGIDDIKDSGIASAAQGKQRELVKKLVSGELDKDSSHKAVNVADLKAVAQAGLDFAGNDSDSIVHKNLGEKLEIVGQGLDKAKVDDFKGTNGNIAVKADSTKTKLEISLNEELKGLKSAEFISEETNSDGTKQPKTKTTINGKGTTIVELGDNGSAKENGKSASYTLDKAELKDGDKSNTSTAEGNAIVNGDKIHTSTAESDLLLDKATGNSNTRTATANVIADKAGNQSVLDKEGLTVGNPSGTDKSNTHYGKDGMTVKGKDGKDAVSLKMSEKNGKSVPTLEFAKVADGKGTGAITGVADLTEDADGTSVANKNYVDEKVKSLDGNRPFDYYIKEGDKYVKVTKGQDDKFYKAEDIKGATYKDGKYTKDGEEVTSTIKGKQSEVVIKAEPSSKPMTITNVKDGDLTDKSTDAVNGRQLVKATGAMIDKDGKMTFADGRDGKAASDTSSMANKGLTSKDGLNGQNANDKANALRNGEAGTVVFTDDKGERLVKANDGKYYKAGDVEDNGTPKADKSAVDNPQLSLVNTGGETDKPVVLGNMASGLGIDAEKVKQAEEEVKAKRSEAERKATLLEAKTAVMTQKEEKVTALKQEIENLSGDEKTQKEAELKAIEAELSQLNDELATATKDLKTANDALKIANNTLTNLTEDKIGNLVKGENISPTNGANIGDLQAVARAGLNFEGNDGVPVHKNLGEKLTIKGEGTFNSDNTAAGNIKVTASDSGMEVKLSDTLKNMTSFETKETAEGNKSRLDGNGLTVTGKNNQSAHYGSGGITLKEGNNKATLTSSALTFTNGQGQKVEIDGKEGEIRVPDLTPNSSPNAVVNKGYIERLQTHTDQKFNHLDNKIEIFNKDLRAGVAGAHAAAALPTVTMPGKSSLALSAGTYKGNNAVALGYSRLSDNGKIMLKLHGSRNSAGDFGGGVGVGWTW
ncbi:YadA-like family protein [Histophilus somni]|uniref:YadA-like family protein n=1 Tax=Histophilus somni TaxID=731 RepID=UPI00201EDC14|nr:YadA-like family protein [Histophilus somni]